MRQKTDRAGALGFAADTVQTITVNCQDCPADPMAGKGPRAARRFVGVTEPRFAGTLILSKADPDQGWRFGQLDDAIAHMPAGPARDRQRAYFDALSLLAVFVQHGDRKAEQQRLVCASEVDETAGDVHPLSENDSGTFAVPALFERPGATSCRAPVALIQDLGATFGRSSHLTTRTNKVHLASWARHPMFVPVVDATGKTIPRLCRGDVVAAFTAKTRTRAYPKIGEAGRRILADLLDRLTDAHIRALFEAGRLDALGDVQEWRDPATGTIHRGIDAWVAVFKMRRAQIDVARCAE